MHDTSFARHAQSASLVVDASDELIGISETREMTGQPEPPSLQAVAPNHPVASPSSGTSGSAQEYDISDPDEPEVVEWDQDAYQEETGESETYEGSSSSEIILPEHDAAPIGPFVQGGEAYEIKWQPLPGTDNP